MRLLTQAGLCLCLLHSAGHERADADHRLAGSGGLCRQLVRKGEVSTVRVRSCWLCSFFCGRLTQTHTFVTFWQHSETRLWFVSDHQHQIHIINLNCVWKLKKLVKLLVKLVLSKVELQAHQPDKHQNENTPVWMGPTHGCSHRLCLLAQNKSGCSEKSDNVFTCAVTTRLLLNLCLWSWLVWKYTLRCN